MINKNKNENENENLNKKIELTQSTISQGKASNAFTKAKEMMPQVLESRPQMLKHIMENFDKPLSLYLKEAYKPNQDQKVAPWVFDAYLEIFSQRYSPEKALAMINQLKKRAIFNTAEHTSLVLHPRRFSSIFLSMIASKENGYKFNFVISTSSVSLNNSSFPIGILWNGLKLKFFSNNEKTKTVLCSRKLTVKDFKEKEKVFILDMIVKKITDTRSENFLEKDLKKQVNGYLNNNKKLVTDSALIELIQIYEQEAKLEYQIILDYLMPLMTKDADSYPDQISRTNEQIFSDISDTELIYLDCETIFPVLFKYGLKNNFILNKVLFDKKIRDSVLDRFSDLPGCWSKDAKKGTHFFWYLTDEGKTISLKVVKDMLVANDNEELIQIPIEPDSILKQLENGKIIPSLFTDFIHLLGSGFSVSGGINQLDYAKSYKSILSKLLIELGETEILENVKQSEITNFIAGPVFSALVENGIFRQISAYDILTDKVCLEDLFKSVSGISFGDAVVLALPSLAKLVNVNESEFSYSFDQLYSSFLEEN